MSILYVTGEHIPAGSSVVVSMIDCKAYIAGPIMGTIIGNAVEELREGLRIVERDGEVREDDA